MSILGEMLLKRAHVTWYTHHSIATIIINLQEYCPNIHLRSAARHYIIHQLLRYWALIVFRRWHVLFSKTQSPASHEAKNSLSLFADLALLAMLLRHAISTSSAIYTQACFCSDTRCNRKSRCQLKPKLIPRPQLYNSRSQWWRVGYTIRHNISAWWTAADSNLFFVTGYINGAWNKGRRPINLDEVLHGEK